MRHDTLAWSWAALCGVHILTPPKPQWSYCCVVAVSIGSVTRGENRVSTATVSVSARREFCHGCCASQKRGCCVRLCYGCCQEPVVPTAPQAFFQSLSLSLAYPGFTDSMHSEIQRDNWFYKRDQQYNWCSWQDTQQVGKPEAPLEGGSHWPHTVCGTLWL